MENSSTIFQGFEHYLKFKRSFNHKDAIQIDLNDNRLTREIYYSMFQLRHAEHWTNKEFNRLHKHSFSEIFQDLLAFYLKVGLPKEYEIILEDHIGNIRPDILIKLNGKNHFVIEVKTNIGWNRNSPEESFEKRIDDVSKAFKIEKSNVIYVFEMSLNTSRAFEDKFYNRIEGKVNDRSLLVYPYNHIYPLFKKMENIEKESALDKVDLEVGIYAKAKQNTICRIEDIIELIIKG